MTSKLESCVNFLVRGTKIAVVVVIVFGVYGVFDGFFMSSDKAAETALPAVEKMLRRKGLSVDDVAGPVCCSLSASDKVDAVGEFLEYGDYLLWVLEWIYIGPTESRVIHVDLGFDGFPEFTHFDSMEDISPDDLEWAECVVAGRGDCETWQSRFR